MITALNVYGVRKEYLALTVLGSSKKCVRSCFDGRRNGWVDKWQ